MIYDSEKEKTLVLLAIRAYNVPLGDAHSDEMKAMLSNISSGEVVVPETPAEKEALPEPTPIKGK